jgi:hypothetical protein
LRGLLPSDEKKKKMREKEIYPCGWWNKEQRAVVENMVTGAVGCVYGNLSSGLKYDQQIPRTSNQSRTLTTTESIQKQSPHFQRLVAVLKFVNTAAPYVVVGVLTRWEKGESTIMQRVPILLWITTGQLGGFYDVILTYGWRSLLWHSWYIQ